MLEKKENLRQIEFIFTDGEAHPYCHCLYNMDIIEDGQKISSSNHRKNMGIDEAKEFLNNAQIKKEVENVLS